MTDLIDRKLVALLQEDGRLTNAELAERVGLSQSACHRRVKRLEDTGVISGYSAFVDRKRIGLNVLAYVFVKMESHAEDLLEAFTRGVDAIDEIVACDAISGDGDYLLKIVAADMDAYAEIALKKVVRLPGVKDSSTNFVLSTMKLDHGWPI
ncbi:MAG: Lrp/AsnC family transcriptional regulator [Pseudomonadota bacterium]